MITLDADMLRLPRYLACRYARRGTDAYEELVAAGNLALVEAAIRCNAEAHNVKPITYIWRCVSEQIATAAGHRKSVTHHVRWNRLLRFTDVRQMREPLQPESTMEADMAAACDYAAKLKAALSERHFAALWLRCGCGLHCKRVAEQMGVSLQVARQTIREAIEQAKGISRE